MNYETISAAVDLAMTMKCWANVQAMQKSAKTHKRKSNRTRSFRTTTVAVANKSQRKSDPHRKTIVAANHHRIRWSKRTNLILDLTSFFFCWNACACACLRECRHKDDWSLGTLMHVYTHVYMRAKLGKDKVNIYSTVSVNKGRHKSNAREHCMHTTLKHRAFHALMYLHYEKKKVGNRHFLGQHHTVYTWKFHLCSFDAFLRCSFYCWFFFGLFLAVSAYPHFYGSLSFTSSLRTSIHLARFLHKDLRCAFRKYAQILFRFKRMLSLIFLVVVCFIVILLRNVSLLNIHILRWFFLDLSSLFTYLSLSRVIMKMFFLRKTYCNRNAAVAVNFK